MGKTIKGFIDGIIYASNGFVVAGFIVENNEQLGEIVVTGCISNVVEGMNLEIKGDWIEHKRYGRQFKIKSYETITPTTEYGIKKFLESGFIYGVGFHLSQKIVEKFGENTLEIIDKEPEKLELINGIGKSKVKTIYESYQKHKDVSKVMVFLKKHDISPGVADIIYEKYGSETIQEIKNNPYILTQERGIGFKRADKIAMSLGFDPKSRFRIKSAAMYILERAGVSGHTFLHKSVLVKKTKKLLGFSKEVDNFFLNKIDDTEIFLDKDRVYLDHVYKEECGLSKLIHKFSLFEFDEFPEEYATIEALDDLINDFDKFELDPVQIEAVKNSVLNKMTVITGGPGTGKTTIVQVLLHVFSYFDFSVSLIAPTGKASNRLEKVTNHEAKTIHRFLGYTGNEFLRNRDFKVDSDVVIVDEASMVDMSLMYALMQALPSCCRFILVGDVDQLPSVQAGNVLSDIIQSNMINTVKLKKIFRQAENSMIVRCAHSVNNGDGLRTGKGSGDLFFIKREDSFEITNLVKKLFKVNIPRGYPELDLKEDVQILTPMKKGTIGVNNFNEILQDLINPNGKEIFKFKRKWREGDKVIQLVNNYELNVFNGEIGVIKSIDDKEGVIVIDFDGNVIERSFLILSNMDLAYAITIHKSQGNEYPAVIIPVHTEHTIMLQRKLLYTAITRAKDLVVLIGTRKAVEMAINNMMKTERNTYLRERLINVFDKKTDLSLKKIDKL